MKLVEHNEVQNRKIAELLIMNSLCKRKGFIKVSQNT